MERPQGHKIYYQNNFIESKNLETPNNLVNIFHISNYDLGLDTVLNNSYKVIYNESDDLSDITVGTNNSNIIINKNQQLTFFLR